MSNKIVTSVDECIGAGKTALYALRPKSFDHVNLDDGVYAHLFTGWRAQAIAVIRRQADEALSLRLVCEGTPLEQLVASEFDVSLSKDATYAIGEVTLTRSGSKPAGVIRAGHPFGKPSDPSVQPVAQDGASYTVMSDVLVLKDQTTATVKIKATKTGSTGNTAMVTSIVPTTPLFDTLFAVTSSRAAGGSQNPIEDPVLRRIASAISQGKYGPIDGAIVAGALTQTGVEHLAVIDNPVNARTVIFPVDKSWSYSVALNSLVAQIVKDSWQGFGCAIQMGATSNKFIHIQATVTLSKTQYLANEDEISDDIRKSLKSYFDDRPDWWTWNASSVKAAIARANRKIQSCTALTITDAVDGSSVSPPSELTLDTTSPVLTHYYLPDNATDITFLNPV